MRIIGGKLGGRKLLLNNKSKLRPTTDFAKEGLFNILEHHYTIEGKKVLDLFSGTGRIGLEFYSRGANHVTFVEKNRQHAAWIRKNMAHLNIGEYQVICGDAIRYLNKLEDDHFDFIFADPPYELAVYSKLVELVESKKYLTPNGLLILEHRTGLNIEVLAKSISVRKFGGSTFTMIGLE